MTAKKTDNRARPKIHRTDDKHDKRLRDWAAKQGLDPWQALEMAIDWLGAPPRTAADLESAREATRRADAEVERLTRELAKLGALKSAEIAPVIERFKEAFGADIPQAPSGRAAPQPCACALPDDLAPRLAAIAARRDVEPAVMLANVIKNGISKIEASDKYQDAQKAARARS